MRAPWASMCALSLLACAADEPATTADGGTPVADAGGPEGDATGGPEVTRPEAPDAGDASTAVPRPNRPFADSSSWNTPVPTGAKLTALAWPKSTGANYWVNWDAYAPAIHRSKATDPLVEVATPGSWGWPKGVVALRIPPGVTGATGTDGEILILDGDTVHNMWQFQRTGDTAGKCSSYASASLTTGSGWGRKSPVLGAGIVATGSSQLAGLLVQEETEAGEIEHALQLVLDAPLQKPGSTGEALGGDGHAPNGISIQGERLALPPSTPLPSGLSPLGAKVFRALVKYGAFNIDTSHGASLLRAQANAFDGPTINALRKDVNTLLPLLQRVD